MNSNTTLTNFIKGQPVTEFEDAHGTLTVRFENATWMRVRVILEPSNTLLQGAKVVQALESPGRLELSLEDGSSVAFAPSDPSHAVSVWDGGGKLLYLG